MNQPPFPSSDLRPAGNQFSLRGLFVLMTAVSLVLALLALVIREPVHWLGTIFVVGFCLGVVAVLEVVRKLFPPKLKTSEYRIGARPPSGTCAADASEGENPFQGQPAGESPFALPARSDDRQGASGD